MCVVDDLCELVVEVAFLLLHILYIFLLCILYIFLYILYIFYLDYLKTVSQVFVFVFVCVL